MVRTLKRGKLHHHAKLRGNQSNRCGDMAIFRFFQYGGHPPSWICSAHVWTIYEGHLVVFITVQDLVGIDAAVSIICTFFSFRKFGLKMPIHGPKIGTFGHSNETGAPTATLPNSAQLGGTAYHPPSYTRVCAVVWECHHRQTDTQMHVTNIHFASSTTHAICNKRITIIDIYLKHPIAYLLHNFFTLNIITTYTPVFSI